ncbi:diguanylate cyclase domain-containing protein [Sulfurivermis fontis]|uniref:diguanylate cyclase domain-containing protein n=1 Tax=Sulfurivermis fontis TaxID=1972068 RepID=UPI000FD71C71|nr:diguanylate cyclase [Sulfurivermis fontis]
MTTVQPRANMDKNLFQRLTTSELDSYAIELEHAVENHTRWVNGISRTLLCHGTPDAADLAAEPHLHCHFGRWYHGIDNPALLKLPEFEAIGPVHEAMHKAARELLLAQQEGKPFDIATYDRLLLLSDEMRRQMSQLRSGFKHNMNLISLLMGKVFENAAEGVLITDPNGVILSVNHAFTEFTGYAAEEAIGKTPALLRSGRQSEAFYRHMWLTLQNEGQWEGEIWNRRKDGKHYLEWLTISGVRDEAGTITHYVAVFSDITSEKENEERLYHLAHYDLLTDLPNRMLFYDRLRQGLLRAKRNNRQVAIMFLDLDGFKQVNDELGHHAGDELLRQVARRLSGVLRASDTVARFGGDEFTVSVPDLTPDDDISRVAQKIIAAVAKPYYLGSNRVQVTTSVGISLFPQDGEDPDSLITHADMAMYETKKGGKNSYRFYAAPL